MGTWGTMALCAKLNVCDLGLLTGNSIRFSQHVFVIVHPCGGLNENGPPRLICLNA